MKEETIKKKEPIKILEDSQQFKRLNQGNTAEIYQYNRKKILKLFRDGMPFELVEDEFRVIEKIQNKLSQVPRVYEIVLYRTRYGIIYQQISGTNLIYEMVNHIYRIKSYSKLLASVQYRFHKVNIELHYKLKEKLCANIEAAPQLTSQEKNKIKRYLNTLPDGKNLCHLDFHPGNVMIKNQAFTVIDWMTACTGNANADAAKTVLLLQFGELQHVNVFLRVAAHFVGTYICGVYIREYKKLSGSTDRDLEQWLLPVAAASLTEWLSDGEKRKLMKLVRKKLRQLDQSINKTLSSHRQ